MKTPNPNSNQAQSLTRTFTRQVATASAAAALHRPSPLGTLAVLATTALSFFALPRVAEHLMPSQEEQPTHQDRFRQQR